ncbi:MAG: insulinase family protein [bacterium]|nr:insulinase family protein [bacterium]
MVEHMVFNGTTTSPARPRRHYLASVGMRVGAEANSCTNHNETVHELQVPTERPEPLATQCCT